MIVFIGITVTCVFLGRVWSFINKKPVNKTPLIDCIIPFLALAVVFICFGILCSVTMYINESWKHIHRPPYTVTVYNGTGEIALFGPTPIPVEER